MAGPIAPSLQTVPVATWPMNMYPVPCPLHIEKVVSESHLREPGAHCSLPAPPVAAVEAFALKVLEGSSLANAGLVWADTVENCQVMDVFAVVGHVDDWSDNIDTFPEGD